jgi:large conductance mechanosensitive channel
MSLINEFKVFLMRGNVVDLAVAVVLAVAFGAVVTSLVADLITPVIAMIFGEPDFSALTFTINGSTFYYGSFINSLISFVTIAAAIFFFVVVPYNTFSARMRKEAPPDPTIRKCPECLSDIPEATRCAFCTAQVAAAPCALSLAPQTRPVARSLPGRARLSSPPCGHSPTNNGLRPTACEGVVRQGHRPASSRTISAAFRAVGTLGQARLHLLARTSLRPNCLPSSTARTRPGSRQPVVSAR